MCASTSFSSSAGSSLAPCLVTWPSTSISSLRCSSDISPLLASAMDVALDLVLLALLVVGAAATDVALDLVLGRLVVRAVLRRVLVTLDLRLALRAVLRPVLVTLHLVLGLVVRAVLGRVAVALDLGLVVFPLLVRHLAPPSTLWPGSKLYFPRRAATPRSSLCPNPRANERPGVSRAFRSRCRFF